MNLEKKLWSYIDKTSKKIKALDFLGGKCVACGEISHWKLCFHHDNVDDKDFGIAELISSRWSLIEKELDKCQVYCQNCHREFHFYEGKIDDRSFKRRQQTKTILLEALSKIKCEICGYDKCTASLAFHHDDSNSKEYNIADMVDKKSYKTVHDVEKYILHELDKTIVVCCNCHSDIHYDKNRFNKYKDIIMEKSKNIKEQQGKIDRDVVDMLLKSGYKQKDVAIKLGASKGTISDIVKELKNRDK